ncbi:STYKc [Musa troglodytarum]|uniref:STYKc n=1 Tax=Musa troglodytarum TaxID=320322 RepID=A0A9E7JUW8_9LILI|nr:STYKc [Musa troglodytarum]URD95312.1 STYKc [Musa troglodytarum]
MMVCFSSLFSCSQTQEDMDPTIQQTCVKVLDWGEDDGMASLRALFRQEVAVWHKLDHPNVTKFIGASMGTADLKIPQKDSASSGHASLPARACCVVVVVVVEYLAGGTLKRYLIRNSERKLAYKDVVRLASDLSRGLSYLHSQKIVHRDVKTENMLLDGRGNLKIADSGVARVEAQNPRDMTGQTGTLGYMAPEVLFWSCSSTDTQLAAAAFHILPHLTKYVA